MGYASKDKKPLKDLVILDDASVALLKEKLPSSTLTTEQLTAIVNQVKSSITIPKVTNDLTDELKRSYDGAVSHAASSHAPTNAQKNSDITHDEIEAKLTGVISTHSHAQNLINVTLTIGTINT